MLQVCKSGDLASGLSVNLSKARFTNRYMGTKYIKGVFEMCNQVSKIISMLCYIGNISIKSLIQSILTFIRHGKDILGYFYVPGPGGFCHHRRIWGFQ
jgi:hypothetical protein